jgi:hypothetical protein
LKTGKVLVAGRVARLTPSDAVRQRLAPGKRVVGQRGQRVVASYMDLAGQ